MPIGTAVHDRTFQLCESLNYREWSGYYAVSAYEAHHEHEYNAIRNASALIDVSPLFKYRVSGRDAVNLRLWWTGDVIKFVGISPEPRRIIAVVPDFDDENIIPSPAMTI